MKYEFLCVHTRSIPILVFNKQKRDARHFPPDTSYTPYALLYLRNSHCEDQSQGYELDSKPRGTMLFMGRFVLEFRIQQNVQSVTP